MTRCSRAAVAALAIVPLAGAAGATAAVPKAPALLPAVTKTVTAAVAVDRACQDAAGARPGIARAAYRAPMSGFLTATLKGKGDWDLVLRDARTRRALQTSEGFGGSEVTQSWVAAGQRVVAQACRREGAARTARVSFRLADVKPPAAAAGVPSLVRVQASQARLHGLEQLGFDVTHNQRTGWADVVVEGSRQLAQLRATGLKFQTRDADLTKSYAKARQADRAFTARVGANGSALPSGRTTYRQYADFQTDMKKLVADHPDRVRPVTFGKTFQGRDITGVEIAKDVNGVDGRPVHFLMGVHHAREWPSGEAAMEFATMMAEQASDPRIAKLLETTRVVVLPIVNVDGYVLSRSAFSAADSLLDQNSNATLVEGVAPPGGFGAYRRKNCDGEYLPPTTPCELAWGIDNNRNYGNLWGGSGGSSDVTSQSYHGPAPRSEPETQAVWNYARTHHVTSLVSLHTVAALVLRPPGLAQLGLAPDEARLKEVGDAMGKAAGYTSQYSWQLYDTAGTTEDDTYAATGGYGYTIEMGPPNGEFHEPYETGVVKEWTGENDHAKGAGGLREALLIAAETAAAPQDHAVFRGTAPPGKVLRLKKAFKTTTSPYCAKGIEPLVNVDSLPNGGAACLTGEKPPITLDDVIDTTTTVPATGSFDWHIGQSTRPFVGGGAVLEETKDVEPPVAKIAGSPGAPSQAVDHEFTLPADQPAQKLRVGLTATLPEDYDIEVLYKDGATLRSVGTSGNAPGSPEEVLVSDPKPGTYVVRVTFFAAATGQYEIVAKRVTTTRTVTTGTKESYVLTCEEPDGTVLETQALQIDRGQVVTASMGCGAGPTVIRQPEPVTAGGTAPAKVKKAAKRATLKLTAARTVRPSKAGALRVVVACPATVAAACRGTLRLQGVLKGKKASTLAAKAFKVAAGRKATVTLKLTRAARAALARRGRVTTKVVASGTAGTTVLSGSRALSLRRR